MGWLLGFPKRVCKGNEIGFEKILYIHSPNIGLYMWRGGRSLRTRIGIPKTFFPGHGKDGVDLPDQEQGEWQVLRRSNATEES